MGIGGISIWQLLIVLAIIVLLFGTKKLGSLGSDLGSAIRGFKDSVKGDEKAEDEQTAEQAEQSGSIEKKEQNASAKVSDTEREKQS